MIDIHAHILPGFDDGAGTMAEAVEMARQASADGIATVVATPHILDPLRPHRDKILSTVTDLRAALRAAGIAVEILPGAEIHIEPEVARAVRDGAAMTIGDAGRHLLLELPLGEMPRYTESVVFDLLSLGVTPIIAHPERNRDLARRPKLLQDLIERGCLAQVSTGSVRGRFGPEARRAAEAFLARGLVHLLGTDAHGPDRRRMIMAEARDLVAARHGTEFARALTADNPLAVLEGRDCRPAAELDGGRQGRRTIAGAIFR